MTRSSLILLLLSLLPLRAARAAQPFGDFWSRADSGNVKPFALDLGGVLGGADFHSGRAMSFPGIELGFVGTIQSHPDREDTIVRGSGSDQIALPMLEAEIALPKDFSLIVHGIRDTSAGIYGGGLRYGIYRGEEPSLIPDLSISAFGDKVDDPFFNAVHYAGNLVASFHTPVVRPFLGAGLDWTKVSSGSTVNPAAQNLSAIARGTRFSAGLEARPHPLVRLYGALTELHGIPGADLGIILKLSL
jgi:hypothetical protein